MTILGPIISLVSQIAQLINTEVLLSSINQLKDLQLQLQAEEAKGYDSDDSKIENLYAQIAIVLQAVNNEVVVFKGASVAQTPAPALVGAAGAVTAS